MFFIGYISYKHSHNQTYGIEKSDTICFYHDDSFSIALSFKILIAIPMAINIKNPNSKKLINELESFVLYIQLPLAIAENISSFL